MLPVAIIGSALYQLRLRIHLHIGNHIAGFEPFPLRIPQITIIRNIDSPRPTLEIKILITVKVQIRHHQLSVQRICINLPVLVRQELSQLMGGQILRPAQGLGVQGLLL